MQADELAAAVGIALKAAIGPLVARIAALEAKAAELDAGALRERLAVLETRAPIPGPPGADGAPGKDGADGLGVKDFEFAFDGRVYTVALDDGRQRKEHTGKTAGMLYRGVYGAGVAYEAGDVVTYGGSSWHCTKATGTRPDTAEGAAYWRLMVKRGDRGRDAQGGRP